jgi:hypothetical protein
MGSLGIGGTATGCIVAAEAGSLGIGGTAAGCIVAAEAGSLKVVAGDVWTLVDVSMFIESMKLVGRVILFCIYENFSHTYNQCMTTSKLTSKPLLAMAMVGLVLSSVTGVLTSSSGSITGTGVMTITGPELMSTGALPGKDLPEFGEAVDC